MESDYLNKPDERVDKPLWYQTSMRRMSRSCQHGTRYQPGLIHAACLWLDCECRCHEEN